MKSRTFAYVAATLFTAILTGCAAEPTPSPTAPAKGAPSQARARPRASEAGRDDAGLRDVHRVTTPSRNPNATNEASERTRDHLLRDAIATRPTVSSAAVRTTVLIAGA
jgi:hypothetical protein